MGFVLSLLNRLVLTVLHGDGRLHVTSVVFARKMFQSVDPGSEERPCATTKHCKRNVYVSGWYTLLDLRI